MNKVSAILLLLLSFGGVALSQTKLDEYGKLISDNEYFHLSYLADNLKQNNTSVASIVVYAPDEARVGSFLRYFYGIGETLEKFGIPSVRFELLFGGASPSRKTELWVLKPGERIPALGKATLSELTSQPIRHRTQFDLECLDCDHSPFIDQTMFGNGLNHLAKALLANQSLFAEILIGRVSGVSKTKKDQTDLRNKIIKKLTGENTIARNRIKIRFIQSDFAGVYLVPLRK